MKKTNNKSEALDRIFHALSDPTRRALLDRLAEQECTITELTEPFRMTFAAVSKHVRVLEDAGFIKREIDGRIHRCKADLEPLQNASSFIDKYKKYWETGFDVLESYLKETQSKKAPKDGRK